MPVSFHSIPDEIGILIAQKLEFRDFLNFRMSSQASFVSGKQIKTGFVVCSTTEGRVLKLQVKHMVQSTDDIAVKANSAGTYGVPSHGDYALRFDADYVHINGDLDNIFCSALIDFLQKSKSTTRTLSLDTVSCLQEMFSAVLEDGKVRELLCWSEIDPTYFGVPAMSQIECIFARSHIYDEHLATLKVKKMFLNETRISDAGINKLLKEIQAGSRIVDHIDIRNTSPFIFNAEQYLLKGVSYIYRKRDNGDYYITIGEKNFKMSITSSKFELKAYE